MNNLFLLKSLLFMNFGQQLFIDYATPFCMASNTGSMMGRCNRVCNQGPINEQEIVDIKNYFKDTHFTWVVDDTDTQTINQLVNHGLHLKAHAPGMILDLQQFKPLNRSDSFTIKEVNDDNDFNRWIEIVSKNYGYSAKELGQAIRFLKQRAGNYLTLYLGCYDGSPEAACMLAYHAHKHVSIHLLGTLSESRNKGLGTNLLNEVLLIAVDKEYTNAILIPSTMGYSLAQKCGFKEYISYKIFGNY